MKTSANKDASKLPPWYKQAWPWFLISLPATAVIAGVITFVIAYKTFDGLVPDDFKRDGRIMAQVRDREEQASRLGLQAEINIAQSDEGETVVVHLKAQHPDEALLSASLLRLSFIHPTQDEHDLVLSLLAQGDGVFSGINTQVLKQGQWIIQLEDESQAWRLKGTITLPTETNMRLQAP